jgi:Putative polyhydroxyalkanoic acid system protein (PHA_gran_rgn)
MGKSITVAVPHDLTPAEVKRRLVHALDDARKKHAELLKDTRETWPTENQMDFVAHAMGQRISGSIEIGTTHVQVSVTLPMLLAIFASKLKPQIKAEGQKLLKK